MDKVKTPLIVLGGITYKAIPPKVKAWHDFVAFEAGTDDIPAEDYMERMAELVASVFGKDVTAERIEREMAITDLKPLYRRILTWIVSLVNVKLSEIPNGEAGPENSI